MNIEEFFGAKIKNYKELASIIYFNRKEVVIDHYSNTTTNNRIIKLLY